LQLNILLAILVEGFMAVKRTNEDIQDSMISELLQISIHEMNRAFKLIHRAHVFVSDEDILIKLQSRNERLALSSVARRRALHDYALITLSSNCMAVPLESGVRLDRARLNSLLFADDSPTAAQQQHRSVQSFSGEVLQRLKPSSSTRARGEMYLNTALTDVLQRYGRIGSPDPAGVSRHFEFQSMPMREESMLGQVPHLASRGIAWKLAVQVVCARHLPRMDLFRGADVFCGVFLEGFPGKIYQTEIRRGRSEAEWRWEDEGEFTWELGGNAAVNSAISAGRAVVVMLYDKDQLSSDDVVGCAVLSLRSVRDSGGRFDDWIEVQRRAAPPPSLLHRFVANFIHVAGSATTLRLAHVQPQIHVRATLLDVDALPASPSQNGLLSHARDGMDGAAVRRSSGLLDPEASLSMGPAVSAENSRVSGGDQRIDDAEPIIIGGHSAVLNSVRCAVGGEIAVYASLPLEKDDVVPSL
jgi:hypothetical protein